MMQDEIVVIMALLLILIVAATDKYRDKLFGFVFPICKHVDYQGSLSSVRIERAMKAIASLKKHKAKTPAF